MNIVLAAQSESVGNELTLFDRYEENRAVWIGFVKPSLEKIVVNKTISLRMLPFSRMLSALPAPSPLGSHREGEWQQTSEDQISGLDCPVDEKVDILNIQMDGNRRPFECPRSE